MIDPRLIISVFGINLTLSLYFFDLRKKIGTLIERDQGVLTMEQAKSLVELYLEAVRKELLIILLNYLKKEYSTHVQTQNLSAIDNIVYVGTDTAIRNCRNKVSSFKLFGGLSFKTFVERISPSDSGVIASAKAGCHNVLQNAIRDRRTDIDRLAEECIHIVETRSAEAGKTIITELEKHYTAR